MYSRLVSWSRYVYLAGIVLALLLVIPTAWFPFQLAKLAVFTLVLAVAAVMFVLGGGAREFLRTHGLYLALIVGALPLSYVLSTLFSTDRSLAFSGVGIETDTVVFVAIAAVAFLFSSVLFRTLRMVRLLTSVVFWTLCAAVAFQVFVIVFGLPISIFSDRSVNLIGKWNDFGIAAGLLALLALVQAEMGHNTLLRRILLAGLLGVLVLLLAAVNFSLVWSFLLVGSLMLGIIRFLTDRRAQPSEEGLAPSGKNMVRRVPWFAAAGVVISTLLLLFGSPLNSNITKIFPVSSLEVRPSFSSTLDVISGARGGSLSRAIIGTGPNTFGESWLLHKPSEVNQSLFWNLDFNVGFSTIVTAFGTAGLVGALGWLTPLFLVVLGVMRVWRLAVLSREEKIAAASLGLASVFLMAGVVLYVPSSNVILLAFILSGATFGFLWRQGQSAQASEASPASKIQTLASAGAMALLLVALVTLAFVVDRRFVAEAYTQGSQYAFSKGDSTKGAQLLASGQKIEKDRNSTRLAVDAGNLSLQKIAADTKTPAADLQTQFTAALTGTIAAGKEAVAMFPSDYQQHLSFARVYDFLSTLKIQGAYESAKQYYTEAKKLNPKNPEISLALARLEAAKGNTQLAQQAITEALTLKPNYTDAILFVVQLNVANNDIPNAIRAATAATQTAPGVGPIWFELGLLNYAAGDTKSAIPALEKAVSIVPDYANAKYFLGLSYYAQKRSSDAIAQFVDLQKSNPDSQEVKLILENMQAGKQPFEAAKPPVSTNPVKRTTAPLP